jgi:hypothetical protein
MLLPDLQTFSDAIANADKQPDTAFAALCQLANQMMGVKLFTVMDYDPGRDLVRRVYSNMPQAYPVSGTKPADNGTPWFGKVIGQHEIFSTNTYEGITEVFDDHELIKSLGCASVVNIPIVVAGKAIGTINCLHEEGFYTQDRIDAAESLKVPGALCLLVHQHINTGEQ